MRNNLVLPKPRHYLNIESFFLSIDIGLVEYQFETKLNSLINEVQLEAGWVGSELAVKNQTAGIFLKAWPCFG